LLHGALGFELIRSREDRADPLPLRRRVHPQIVNCERLGKVAGSTAALDASLTAIRFPLALSLYYRQNDNISHDILR
jgi:hypothetical protein